MAHSFTNLLFHTIFATKERRPLIDEEFQPRLYDYLGATIRGLKGSSLEIGGIEDHLHILAKLPPTISVSDFLEKLKANTSKWGKSVRRGLMAGWLLGFHGQRVPGGARQTVHTESTGASCESLFSR
jgi:REP-associated tyrosine transposase